MVTRPFAVRTSRLALRTFTRPNSKRSSTSGRHCPPDGGPAPPWSSASRSSGWSISSRSRRTFCSSGRTLTCANTREIRRSILPPGSPTRSPSIVSFPCSGSTEQRETCTVAAVASSIVATAYAQRLLATKSVRRKAMAAAETTAAASPRATRMRLSTRSARLGEPRQVPIDLPEVDRLSSLHHGGGWNGDRPLRPGLPVGSGAAEGEVVGDTLDHLVVDHRDPGHVALEQRVVAESIDHPWRTARKPMDRGHGGGRERHPRRSTQPEAMLDVRLCALRIEMVQPVFHGHALCQRRIELQVLLDLRQPEEDQVEQLPFRDFQVEQPAELLHQLPGGEHLRLVDQDHRLLAGFVDADQPLVELAEQGELVLAGRVDAQLEGDALEQPGSGHAAVDDHQQGGFVLVLRERIEQPACQRGLPRADVADEDAEPLHLRAEVREPHQGLRVLRRVEVEARDRRVRERLLGQLVVVEIVHQTKPIFRFLREGSGPGSGELPPRVPAVAGVLVEWAATFLAATAGLEAGRAISLGVALTLPPSRCTRSATSRKLGSSAWMAWYHSQASASSPRASYTPPSSNWSACRAGRVRAGSSRPCSKWARAVSALPRSISHMPSMVSESAARVPPPCRSATSNSAIASSRRPISL